MHTTGCRESYGRWYTLSTRSMPATKYWLCFCGMHHISRRHGFNSFFLTPAARSPRKSIDHFKPHQLFRQHLHGPPNAAFRWNRTGHLNQTRFLLPIQLLRHRRQRPRPALQSLHRTTLLHRPPTHVLAGPLRHPQRKNPPPACPSVPGQRPLDPRNGIRLVNFSIRLRIRSWALVIR